MLLKGLSDIYRWWSCKCRGWSSRHCDEYRYAHFSLFLTKYVYIQISMEYIHLFLYMKLDSFFIVHVTKLLWLLIFFFFFNILQLIISSRWSKSELPIWKWSPSQENILFALVNLKLIDYCSLDTYYDNTLQICCFGYYLWI